MAFKADALNKLGRTYGFLGEYDRAIEYYDRAFAIRQQIIETPEIKNFLK